MVLQIPITETKLHRALAVPPCMQVFAEHPLALFYHCDAAVSYQMHQLGHLMKNSPDNLDRRSTLIQQLKEAQHNLVNVLMHLTTLSLPKKEIASRDFQAKYPDDINLDQLNGAYARLAKARCASTQQLGCCSMENAYLVCFMSLRRNRSRLWH